MTKILFILKMSFNAIFKNKVRSFLSVLGIAIGIGAVISMLALGNGAQDSIQTNVEQLGTNNITLSSRPAFGGPTGGTIPNPNNPSSNLFNRPSTVPISKDEYLFLSEDVKQSIPNINLVAGVVNDTFQLKLKDESELNATINAISENYFELQNLKVSLGSIDLSGEELEAVLGSSLAKEIIEKDGYESVDELLGKEIQMNGDKYIVKGILEDSESLLLITANSSVYISVDDYFELNTDRTSYSSVVFSVFDDSKLSETDKEIENKLREYRGLEEGEESNFNITTTEDLASTITQITNVITLLLSGISAISLLVGGIGISNIMLVSVTERTKEIGLRKAIGAKQRYILLQFLAEAVILTLIGGIAGILLGYAMSVGVGRIVDIIASVKVENIILATSISSFIGIVFGFVPALNASRLSPVEALRYE